MDSIVNIGEFIEFIQITEELLKVESLAFY